MSLNKLYNILSVSKQSVHQMFDRWNQLHAYERQLLLIIQDVRADHPTMGCRDMYFKIQPDFIGRDAFEHFCKQNGLSSKVTKNFCHTTDSSGVVRFDNLLIDCTIERWNQVWQSDITYYEVNNQFYYLTFILDGYSRRILGHATSSRINTESTTLPALKMAIKTRKGENLQGLIFHSDGGGQYYDKEFLRLTKKYNFRNSMCEYPWDNGKAERINGVIKNNYLRHRCIHNFRELVKEVDRSVHLYNYEKPHKKLQRKTPILFEQSLLALAKQLPPTMKKSLKANSDFMGHRAP